MHPELERGSKGQACGAFDQSFTHLATPELDWGTEG